MADTIRSFIAIELPPRVIDSIRALESGLRASGVPMRWVRPENIHLTVKFLGDVLPEQVAQIHAALGDSVAGAAPFALTAAGLGVFPDAVRPRVLWVGLCGQTDALFSLRRAVEDRLGRHGFPREDRPFRGHLTLGRAKERIDGRALGRAIQAHAGYRSEGFWVDRLCLFKSELKPSGPEYTRLVSVTLA